MNSSTDFKSGQLQSQMQGIATAVRALAQDCQGDSLALVALLRRLEELHREIREGLFQASLPDNRQALYALVKDIETEGGWPYIERMKLQSLLANLPAEGEKETEWWSNGVNLSVAPHLWLFVGKREFWSILV